LGIRGYNKSDGSRKLIAAYGNDLLDVDTNLGYSLNLTSTNKVEFEVFLDDLFFQNYNHTPLTFDGSVWTNKHVTRTPLAKFMKVYGARMYLGYLNVNGAVYPSRVWYSDLPKNDTITWGLSYGSDGTNTANNNVFTSEQGGFLAYNIKVGDPLFITSGANKGQYTVSEVETDNLLRVEETIVNQSSGQSYWVGGNFFDVRTDDNDEITWLGENNDRLMVFKRNSLHRYDGSSLRTVKGVPGTTSGRSVVNLGAYTLYFHGSTTDKTGFYIYDGTTSTKISNPIQPFIDGIDQSNYPLIVSWTEGNIARAFVGDLTNTNEGISITNCVISYDSTNNSWSTDPIGDIVRCATSFRDPEEVKILIGNNMGQVLETPSGYSFNGDPIAWVWETQPIYPRGAGIMNIMTKVTVIGRDANGTNISYKLWDNPYKIDDKWTPLGDLEYDRTDFIMPYRHNNACGISFRGEEISDKEPTPHIETIIVTSYAQRSVTPEVKQII